MLTALAVAKYSLDSSKGMSQRVAQDPFWGKCGHGVFQEVL